MITSGSKVIILADATHVAVAAESVGRICKVIATETEPPYYDKTRPRREIAIVKDGLHSWHIPIQTNYLKEVES